MSYEIHKARALRLQAQAMREEAKAYACDGKQDMTQFCERMADTLIDEAVRYDEMVNA